MCISTSSGIFCTSTFGPQPVHVFAETLHKGNLIRKYSAVRNRRGVVINVGGLEKSLNLNSWGGRNNRGGGGKIDIGKILMYTETNKT